MSPRLLFVPALLAATLVPATTAQLGGAIDVPVGTQPDASVIADLDGDGDGDVAVTVDAPDRVSILFSNGDGTFGAPISVLTGGGTSPHTPVAADLDGDGDLDLAVTLQNVNQVRVIRNDGGAFVLGSTTATGLEPRDIAAADLNGDGLADLVTGNRDGSSVTILLNTGAATFSSTTLGVGQEVRGVATGDLDGDGDVDVTASAHDDRRLDLLLNAGNGTFVSGGSVSLGFQLRPEGVRAADLDGDGDVDLAAAASGNGLNVVTVFANAGGGVFGGFTSFATGGVDPSYLDVLDVDLDGDADLAVANTDSNTVGLLANAGNGSFGPPTLLAVGSQPGHVASGDVDGNGGPDLAVTNETSGSVSVLLNTQSGSAFVDLGGGLAGVAGIPSLVATSTLEAGSPLDVALTGAAPSAPAGLVVGFSQVNVSFKGGILVPSPDVIFVLATDALGTIALSETTPAGVPSGTDLILQYIVSDAVAVAGFALSNAVAGTTP